MRILVVSNLYPPVARGGYETRCAATVEELRREHDVAVLTSDAGGPPPPGERGVVRALPWLEETPAGSLRAPAAALRAVRLARAVLAYFRPDLVYVWNGSNIPHAALRVFEAAGGPVAYSVGEHWYARIHCGDQFMRHLLPGDTGARAVWAAGLRTLNRLPALRLDPAWPAPVAVCWNSRATRRLAAPPPSQRVVFERVIHPAVAREDFYAGLPRAPAEDPLIAFVGRVEAVKGPEVAVRALAALRERHGIEARLVCCGEVVGTLGEDLRALADKLGVRLELRGRLGPDALGEVLSAAHALVVPSTWEEPFGLVCVEGALARVPLVASRSGGIPEAMHDEEHALLFATGDAEACAAALHRALAEPGPTAARVERAFRRARDELSWASYADAQRAFVEQAREALR